MTADQVKKRPIRVQLSRAKGWRMPANTKKVDRSTRYGNPFLPTDIRVSGPKAGQGQPIGGAGAVQAFRNHLTNLLRLEPQKTRQVLDELRGKNLACWCELGEPCHADVLLELANKEAPFLSFKRIKV